MAEPDVDLGNILADQLNIPLRIDYGRSLSRDIVVETVYGWTFDAPEFVRGPDSLTGEPRTFRVDRIDRLHGCERFDDIAWFLGQLIKSKLGLELNRPPKKFRVSQPVRLQIIDHDETTRFYVGEVTGADFRYRETGACLTLEVSGKPEDGSKRRSSFRLHLGPGGYGRQLVEIWDLTTGGIVPDIMAWLDRRGS
ncbi:hypothetical protein [uncultured Brevundimonas sp.]|uniref:hypothetical protein n=1 Tax=uncultured Brevundimonas sp. TaxID=213418 RepID=UPI002606844C|nr:hypothetical protein [uncultured Brevundimonas sp.]